MKKAAGWCNYMEGILFLVVTAPPPSALPHRPGFVCGGEHLCCNTWQWRASFAAVVLLCSVWSWEALVSPAGGHLFRSTIAFLYLFSLPAVCVGGACCLFLCAFWLLFFFPGRGRYVAVSKVLETRRGRCGEYSVLMMRLLEALGYSCRWVVDWSDHVWVEARVGGNWVHVDPCEVTNRTRVWRGRDEVGELIDVMLPPFSFFIQKQNTDAAPQPLKRRRLAVRDRARR